MIVFSLANKVVSKLLYWREIHMEREQLSRMGEDLLKDIGISKAEAEREANRPFWDASSFADKARLKRHLLH